MFKTSLSHVSLFFHMLEVAFLEKTGSCMVIMALIAWGSSRARLVAIL